MSKLLPKKHISSEQSYLGFGAKIISMIKEPISLEKLWHKCNNSVVKHGYKDLILTLDYLYLVNIISVDEEGYICLN